MAVVERSAVRGRHERTLRSHPRSIAAEPCGTRRRVVTTIALSSADPAAIAADAIVVGVTADDDAVRLHNGANGMDQLVGASFAATLQTLGAKGKADEVIKVPTSGAA